MNIDFEKIEKDIVEKFNSTVKQPDDNIGKMVTTIGMMSARVAIMAIQEYHKLLLAELEKKDNC
nr:hypothetical protein [Aneurinibacillus sp. XH2]